MKAPDAEIRAMLFEVGMAEAHSHMPRGNWMVLLLEKLDLEDAAERMRVSYDLVFPNLPKKVRDTLC